jgi:pantothenate kinase/acyl dehydratase
VTSPSLAALTARARVLADDRGHRVIIGIAGAPGAGKSTLAAALSSALGAPLVPMDGFHLRNAELISRGRLEQKGAPDTFDALGYVDLLTRLRAGVAVAAPVFDRAIEEPVPDAIIIDASAPIVLTEGNYLLLDDGPWTAVRDLLDEVWFISVDEDVRLDRLTARHIAFGRSPTAARERALVGSDAHNARLIAPTASRADLIVTVLASGVPVPSLDAILAITISDGSYDLDVARHAQLLRHIHAPAMFTSATGDVAHPVFAHLANQGGLGITFEDLMAAVGASAADGVVIGSGTFDFHRPITVGASYVVRASVIGVERKHGRRMGPFDAITLQFDLVDVDGRLVVTMTEVYIVPRRSAAASSPSAPTSVVAAASPAAGGYPVGPITGEDILGIVDVMGDTNPIHRDEAVAIASGFRGIVNQAPANLAYVLNAMAVERGNLDGLQHVAFTFRDAVIEGDRLDVLLTRDVAPDREVIAAELVIAGGSVAVLCRAEFELPATD